MFWLLLHFWENHLQLRHLFIREFILGGVYVVRRVSGGGCGFTEHLSLGLRCPSVLPLPSSLLASHIPQPLGTVGLVLLQSSLE